MQTATTAELVRRAAGLATQGTRRLLGIAGAPGAGKSTLAALIAAELGADLAVLVPMDGFHLASDALERLELADVKGAVETFDGWGYLALLQRLLAQPERLGRSHEGVVYAPRFDRSLEDPVGSAIPVRAAVPLVITEGNYLLADDEPWASIRALLTESWFLAPEEPVRMSRLIARHERFGRSHDEALERSHGSDQRNAEFIETTAQHADLIVRIADNG